MVSLKDFFLPNGLHVVVNENHDVQIAVLDLIYRVGSRDDFAKCKGMAHLFEHLMFCGSLNVKNFDTELQNVGGSNNAYTNLDLTNYYCSLPCTNIETAFWLESDRMFNLNLSDESIAIQKNVVTEELKESYYGTPYSDLYLHLHPAVYPLQHPYHSPTIGFEDHIANTTREDLLNFYNFYRPDNAILVVSGNVEFEQIKKLSEKYFLIPHTKKNISRAVVENVFYPIPQKEKIIKKEIPSEYVCFAYKTCARKSEKYFATLLLSEILDCGKSSLLYIELVDEKKIFTNLNVEFDNCELQGNLLISGMVSNKVSVDVARNTLMEMLNNFFEKIDEKELTKAKNNLKLSYLYETLDLTNCADIIANSFLLDDKNFINEYISRVESVDVEIVQCVAKEIFFEDNRAIFLYKNKL